MNCVACEGTGVSSRGRPCSPCAGTGKKGGYARERDEELNVERVKLLIQAVRITVEDEPEGGWLEGWEGLNILSFWGLTEVDQDKVRITDKAISFVLGEAHLPVMVSIEERLSGKSSKCLNARQVLGDDYDELTK